MYEIRLCRSSEVEMLLRFLKNSWKENHVFLRDKGLLDFQHKSTSGYNFVVAYHLESKCFHGVLGLISPEFYCNHKISTGQDIWLAIWKVDKSLSKSNSLGLDMLGYVESSFNPRTISAIGINESVAVLYKIIGFKIRKMRQWFIPNLKLTNHTLVKGNLPKQLFKAGSYNYNFISCGYVHAKTIDQFLADRKSNKNFKYLEGRYLSHPKYSYKIYAFLDNYSEFKAILVGREIKVNDSKVFRITDLFYEKECSVDFSLHYRALIEQNSYEYLDFIEYGFDETALIKSGFFQSNKDLYVPHLFEPFNSDRKEVRIAFKSSSTYSCTKGDSDLDRPNQ